MNDQGRFWAPTKLFYFCFFAALCIVSPYLPLYYKTRGISGWQMGVLTALPPLVGLLAGPLWGMIADATQRHRRVLLLALAGAGLSVPLVLRQRTFGAIFLCILTYAFFAATIIPLIDSTTLQILGERRGDYGRHRVWGTLGWMLLSPVAGMMAGRYGLHAVFWIYYVFIALTWLAAARLPNLSGGERVHLWAGLRILLHDHAWRMFLFVALLGGMGLSLIHNYLFLYMDTLKLSDSVKGWTMVSSTAGELPIMWMGAWLLRRVGARFLIAVSLLVFAIRCFCYAFANTAWEVLLIQLLHGGSYGFLWIGGTGLAHRLAPPGWAAAAQGVFAGIAVGLGAALGAFLGGVMLQKYGVRAMFIWAGMAELLGLVVFFSIRWVREERA